jgi:heme O synthase-like polyprenyltransferase
MRLRARNWLRVTYVSVGTTLFLWQFPHFFSLAWLAKDDYARGQYREAAGTAPLIC